MIPIYTSPIIEQYVIALEESKGKKSGGRRSDITKVPKLCYKNKKKMSTAMPPQHQQQQQTS